MATNLRWTFFFLFSLAAPDVAGKSQKQNQPKHFSKEKKTLCAAKPLHFSSTNDAKRFPQGASTERSPTRVSHATVAY